MWQVFPAPNYGNVLLVEQTVTLKYEGKRFFNLFRRRFGVQLLHPVVIRHFLLTGSQIRLLESLVYIEVSVADVILTSSKTRPK